MAGTHVDFFEALVFGAFVAWIAWKCIPKAIQSIDSQQLPTRETFFDKHLHRVYGLVDDDCIVCRDECEMPVRIDLCGHITCESCAVDWFAATRENKRCPQCQAIVMAPEAGTCEALSQFSFTVAVFNLTAATCLALITSHLLYFLGALLLCGDIFYHYSCAMIDAGGDWWRQVSNGPDHDFWLAVVLTIGPWAMIAFLFDIQRIFQGLV